jgi:hypothetical protein
MENLISLIVGIGVAVIGYFFYKKMKEKGWF